MKNNVITIIFLLLIVLFFTMIFAGIKIGNFQILSISELKTKNGDLDSNIEKAKTLTSIDYPQSVEKLEDTYEQYNVQKEKYEELSGMTDEDNKRMYETKQYDIGYIWRIFGKYATSRNLSISMDVKKSSGQNLYDLNFTISGQYVNTSEFIAELENNSDLNFRIYNFKMTGSSETVTTSFTVKDVNINPSTIKSSTTSTSNLNSEQENNNTTEDNTTENNTDVNSNSVEDVDNVDNPENVENTITQ